MEGRRDRSIVIRGAREHNLKGFDVEIPRGRLTMITGVSGSGKSSLAFDTIFREGQRRFLEMLPSFSRQFAGRFARPAVTSIDGLGPAVAVSQRASLSNPRSTVGTLTEVWDLLRVLYARRGDAPAGVLLTRGLFSFNGEGACPACRGLGVEDRLDPELIVADASKTLRGGALRVSTPNGYLMYSQVTLQVLDDVLRAHGGSVDVPWRELAEEVRQVVLHGSDRLHVPYGKHPLESRLKWTGITPRPRQEGLYRGLVPVMEEILRGKRNDSILRFVRSSPCGACGGTRLRPEARSVTFRELSIAELAAMTASELDRFLAAIPAGDAVIDPIRDEIAARCALMAELGLSYLAFDRPAPTLSLGEAQRLRLLSLASGDLRGLVVVLDEPSAGLHAEDVLRLLRVLRRLRDHGQTVVVVEHDAILARAADWLVDLGPGPGASGGGLLWSGPPASLVASGIDTPTRRWLAGGGKTALHEPRPGDGELRIEHLRRHNLQDVAFDLRRRALNVVAGVSGAGKSSLLDEAVAGIRERGSFARIVFVDAAPIGRTPRSNAATYTGAFDLIRDLFAATEEAKARGLDKGCFTFNKAGGRCEACEGAGVIEVGMRHLGNVDLPCEACGGRRFHADVLEVPWRGRSIADVLEGSIADAAGLFVAVPRLARILGALLDCGLGYLPLGQPATQLSGGEAQRVKLAAELARAEKGDTLVALDEPSTGLHAADVELLLEAWDRLIRAGHTLLVVDNDPLVVGAADRAIELGPGSGPDGGRIVAVDAAVARRAMPEEAPEEPTADAVLGDDPPMELWGVTTNNLRSIDVSIPARGLTVVTGPSGSGKSSLVFDTLLAEAQARFNDLVSPWARRLLPRRGGAELAEARGLRAAVAVPQRTGRRNPRSRVGTLTELDELLRMLYSRAGSRRCPACGGTFTRDRCACGAVHPPLLSSAFSPNSEAGACPGCKGLGFVQLCDPARLAGRPERPLDGGAMDGTRFGAYLGEPDGRFVATLRTVGAALDLDFSKPWEELPPRAREIAMRGAGERVFDVEWRYKRGRSEGVHRLSAPWEGFAALVDREYERVHLKTGPDSEGEALEELLRDEPCPRCGGERLADAARAVTLGGLRLPRLAAMTLDEARAWFERLDAEKAPMEELRGDVLRRLGALCDAGLGYLSLDREIAALSGGETQRVRLAAALGGGLTGVAYALDEPTQGLHPRDTARLAAVLRRVADAGNAVVVVEHDAELVARADCVIELGPGAGKEGGRIVEGGAHGRRAVGHRTGPADEAFAYAPGVTLRGARLHNLRDLEVTFPAGALTAVTGVSGSGKSTLVLDVLGASLRARAPIGCARLLVHEPLDAVLTLDQDAAFAGAQSSVATLAGVAEPLRRRLAATPEAKERGFKAKHFSTASPGGRCEACEGRGVVTVAMDLLPDVTVGCEACGGARFGPEALACRLEGRSVAELLDASAAELADAFSKDERISRPLRALCDIGLGYLPLGQEARALSAGELQRMKIAALLCERQDRRAAILLDEPTRGLGAADVDRLVDAMRALARAGNLVVTVEHNLELIAAADWAIDLGPEGGPGGGTIVAACPPAELAQVAASHTGRALAERISGP
ncbi:MAG: ATP-binding cassette domain-containing protein [Proteobacteria bacterium]|nr:ATP-binding cassette domain-containing protein [Pseudomonadota bacterium]